MPAKKHTFTIKMKKVILHWYEGEYIPEPPNSLCLTGRFKRHWTSSFTHTIFDFYIKEWKWLLLFIVAVISAFIAIIKL